MNEQLVVKVVADLLRGLKEDKNDAFSPLLFKEVISNNVVPWTAITTFPSVCVALGSSEYSTTAGSQITTSQLQIFVYNKYRTSGVNLPDILSFPIQRVREAITNITDLNILDSDVISSARDNGTLQPYTVAELVANIRFVETTPCA